MGVDQVGNRGVPLSGLVDDQRRGSLRCINHHRDATRLVRNQIAIGRHRAGFKSLDNHSMPRGRGCAGLIPPHPHRLRLPRPLPPRRVLLIVQLLVGVRALHLFLIAQIEAARRTPQIVPLQLLGLDVHIAVRTRYLFHARSPLPLSLRRNNNKKSDTRKRDLRRCSLRRGGRNLAKLASICSRCWDGPRHISRHFS